MDASRLAQLRAHQIAQELLESDTPPDGYGAARTVVTIGGRDIEVEVNIRPAMTPCAAGDCGSGKAAPGNLRPHQQRIVDLLAGQRDRTQGRKAEWIAAKLRVKCGGSFRGTLADLVRFGVLEKVDDGYRLADVRT